MSYGVNFPLYALREFVEVGGRPWQLIKKIQARPGRPRRIWIDKGAINTGAIVAYSVPN
jgi:hypothetical protein